MESVKLIGSIGHLNLDIYLKVKNLPMPDSRETCEEVYIAPGGAATNYAIAISKLCGKSYLFATCGLDIIGDFLIKNLEVHNVDTSHVRRVREQTGMVIVIVDERGIKYMIGIAGANKHLELSNEDLEFVRRLDHVHVVLPEVEILKRVLNMLRTVSGISISIGLRTEIARKGVDLLEEFGIRYKFLFMNLPEALLLVRCKDYRCVKHRLKRLDVADEIVVTLGEKGSVIFRNGDELHINPISVSNVVDTTGAGDVYSAVYTYMRLLDIDPKTSAVIASAYAALKCTRRGASNIPDPVEVCRLLEDTGHINEAEILISKVLQK